MTTNPEENPLLKALPPQTDYISYLTLLEYNLDKTQLPILHDILQDTTLTSNIGWDLVHLLLPLLPESQACLQDVARLGNPREVILKVTELLEELAHADGLDLDQEPDTDEDFEAATRSDATEIDSRVSSTTAIQDAPTGGQRFSVLVDMLCVLQPRIKTKYPSRFLTTSLQAVLSAYASLQGNVGVTESSLGLIKQLSGSKRPTLPPRKSSSTVLVQNARRADDSAPDPEADLGDVASGEHELQNKLLQSFLTFICEVYISHLESSEMDVNGLSWATRYRERKHPAKCIPGRPRITDLFSELDHLHERDSIMGQILALAQDLSLTPGELNEAILPKSSLQSEDSESNLPSSASEIPLSQTGSLFILCTRFVSPFLFDGQIAILPQMTRLTSFASLVNTFVSPPTMGGIGTENPSLLDALFFYGYFSQEEDLYNTTISKDDFNEGMQRLSMLSARLPSPDLRYHAYLLSKSLLQSQSDEDLRMAYIEDTLEHCPYENLKASTVEFLKDEFLQPTIFPDLSSASPPIHPDLTPPLFATPNVLHRLGKYLWPKIDYQNIDEADYDSFQASQVYYLALLNLQYLMFSNSTIAKHLDIHNHVNDINDHFLHPLMQSATAFEAALLGDKLSMADDAHLDSAVSGCRLIMSNIHHINEATEKGATVVFDQKNT